MTNARLLTSDGNITWMKDGEVHTVGKSHANYNQLLSAYKDNDYDQFVASLDVVTTIRNYVGYTDKGVEFDEQTGKFLYCGQELNNNITERIFHLKKEGLPFDFMVKFLENRMNNPNFESGEQLYQFLENKNLPITEDGCFLAYKTVKVYEGESFTDVNGREVKAGDYVDKYSSSVRNNVGDEVSMPRNLVDNNRNHQCSHGYHCGALHYAGPGGWYNREGNIVLVVKVNPEDAVSVPQDHDCGKLRVCKYVVVSEYKQPLERAAYTEEGEEFDEPWEYNDDFAFVDVEDVEEDDEISFLYPDANGELTRRFGTVVTTSYCYICINPHSNDPGFLYNTDTQAFNVHYISDINFL